MHFIGNPPFSRRASTAVKFIKHAAKSFKKESMQKHIPLRFHLVYQCDLEEDSFTINGEDKHISCVLQIWKKKECERVPHQISDM